MIHSHQYKVQSIWETFNAYYMHLNESVLITNQSLVPLEMEIRNTKQTPGHHSLRISLSFHLYKCWYFEDENHQKLNI